MSKCFVEGCDGHASFGYRWPGFRHEAPAGVQGYLWACYEHRDDAEKRRDAALEKKKVKRA